MSQPLSCPRCGNDCPVLVIPVDGKLQCRDCAGKTPTKFNPRLNWTLHRDKAGTRVTVGKAWEIDNRVISKDDGRSVVNRITGKPAQY